jgi:hypothetical protein
MKTFAVASAVLASSVQAEATETNPVAKVIDLLSGLQAKIVGEGEEAQKVYDDYAEWCEDTAKNSQFEIKTGKATSEDLKAAIGEEATRQETLTAKLGELAESIATDEADLTAATQIRDKEFGDFSSEEKELVEVIDTLGRAVGILEKEAAGGASMLQLQNAGGVVQALNTIVQASLLSSADGARLTALVQSSQDSEDDDAGSPAAAVYENHSGGIVDVLADLKEKAEGQLDDARKKRDKGAAQL